MKKLKRNTRIDKLVGKIQRQKKAETSVYWQLHLLVHSGTHSFIYTAIYSCILSFILYFGGILVSILGDERAFLQTSKNKYSVQPKSISFIWLNLSTLV